MTEIASEDEVIEKGNWKPYHPSSFNFSVNRYVEIMHPDGGTKIVRAERAIDVVAFREVTIKFKDKSNVFMEFINALDFLLKEADMEHTQFEEEVFKAFKYLTGRSFQPPKNLDPRLLPKGE